jgi:hypothetical protein
VSWYPAGLPVPILGLVRAIDQRFQLARPNGPVRLAAYTTTQLQALTPTDYMAAIDKTAKKPVFAVPNAGDTGFRWVYADGTAV